MVDMVGVKERELGCGWGEGKGMKDVVRAEETG